MNAKERPTTAERVRTPEPVRTIAEGRRRIERLYSAADRFLTQTVVLDSRRADMRVCRSMAVFETEAEIDQDAAALAETWNKHRTRTAAEMRQALADLAAIRQTLETAAADAGAMLDYSAAAMGLFTLGEVGFPHVAGALWHHFFTAEALARRSFAVYSRTAIDLRDPRLQADWDAMGTETLGPVDQAAITARIRVERSQLLRDLRDFLAMESGDTPDKESAEPLADDDSDRLNGLKPCERSAYLAAQYAEMKLGQRLTDREAWKYITESGIDDDGGELADYRLPLPDTFADYLNRSRRKLNEPKYTPRGRRSDGSRSVLKRSEI